MGVGDVLLLGEGFQVPVKVGHVLELNVGKFIFGFSERKDVQVLEYFGEYLVCVFWGVLKRMASAIIVKEPHSVMERPL